VFFDGSGSRPQISIGGGAAGKSFHFTRIMRKILYSSAMFVFFWVSAFPGRGMAQGLESDARMFGKIIRSIQYSADQSFERSHFDSALGIKPGDLLTLTAVKGAIQALYDTRAFSSIDVDAVEEEGGVRLQFNLRFNYYFNDFSIEGKLDLGGRSLRYVVDLPIGERYTGDRLEEVRQAILSYAHQDGYYLAKVENQVHLNESSRQVDTLFVVQRGEPATLKSVDIKGVTQEDARVIHSVLKLHAGDKMEGRKLRQRLSALRNYFSKRGYLAAAVAESISFEPQTNETLLTLTISNFGEVRVVVDGFRINKSQLRQSLPVLSGEELSDESLEEGAKNIREYLEERGYPLAEINIKEEVDKSGIRVVHYEIDKGPKTTVDYVVFSGNKAFSSQELSSSIQIHSARFLQRSVYSVAKLDADIDTLKALYQSKGYLDAKIVPLIVPVKGGQRLGITFECEEGTLSRIETLTINGNASLPASVLESKLSIQSGSPYSPILIEGARNAIVQAYNDNGFLQAKITTRSEPGSREGLHKVEFTVEEGNRSIISDVLILGNKKTRLSLVQKEIVFKKDEPLSQNKMLETQQNLYKLGIFDLVQVVQQNPESPATYQNVVVRVEEANRFTMRYGIGYQERDQLRGSLEFNELNVFGTGFSADFRLRGSSIEQSGTISVQRPGFRYLAVDSYASFSAQKREEVSFDAKRLAFSYQYGHPINSHSWGLLRYTFQNIRLSNLQVSMDELGGQGSRRNLSTFSAIYINDTRDNYLDAEKGFFTSTNFSITTKLLGSYDYFSIYTQDSYFRKLTPELLMAANFRFGFAHPFGGDTSLPISERFFAGGASSLRGFDTDYAGPLDANTNKPVGGGAIIVGNLELRVPVYRAIHVAGFYDGGNVYRALSDIGNSSVSHTVGLGLRIKTPVGPLRLDYGVNLNLLPDLRARGLTTGHLFITIGSTF
jgi:outer membrane protein insertion porin family